MSLTRRTLLQQTSLALASFGLSQMGLSLLTRRYQRVLATPTSRKLALLIGIDSYPDHVFNVSSWKGPSLRGAVTDVELVRELLLTRFGFNPADILILKDKQATREAIESALQSHFLGQVGQDDVVVFHCSGLGSYVRCNPSVVASQPHLAESGIYPAFVPVDGRVARSKTDDINDITLSTLALFLGALPTRNILSILDFGYVASTPVLGNLRVRSRLNIPVGALSKRVFEQYQTLGKPQQVSFNDMLASPIKAWPGLVITAADSHGVATEAPWGGFTAGLLTYTLTQRLWWATPSLALNKELGQVISSAAQFVGSQYRPSLAGLDAAFSGSSTKKSNLLSLSGTKHNADGVVCHVDTSQKEFKLWMGGLPALVLQHCSTDSYVRFLSPSRVASEVGTDPVFSPWAQVRSHTQLMAKAKFCPPANAQASATGVASVTPGMLVQEVVRVIPQDIDLVLALGNELERIERVDATSSLSSLGNVKSTTAGEQQVDCVFDKVRASDISILPFSSGGASEEKSGLNIVISPERGTNVSQLYGLFQPGRNLIPGTMSTIGEAVKTAIRRVTPQFDSLLSEKLLRLTVNQGSSRLGGRVTLETAAPFARQVGQQYTSRSPFQVPGFLPITPQQEDADHPTLFVGDQIQCRLQNYSDRALYGILFNIDSRGNVTVLHPLETESPDETSALDTEIPARTITTIPAPTTSFPWTVSNSLGIATIYVIMSCSPFTRTITELSKLVPSVDTMHRPQTVSSPLPIVRAMLADLHDASQPYLANFDLDLPSDRYNLSVDCWATFSFTYNVSTTVSLESSTAT